MKTGFSILDLYYENKYYLMLILCILNEGFYLGNLLWLSEIDKSKKLGMLLFVFTGGFLLKTFVHLEQLVFNLNYALE